jgi:hypothetical protein
LYTLKQVTKVHQEQDRGLGGENGLEKVERPRKRLNEEDARERIVLDTDEDKAKGGSGVSRAMALDRRFLS